MWIPMRSPLHQRWKTLGRIRGELRRRYFEILRRSFAADDGRQIICDAASALRVQHPRALLQGLDFKAPFSRPWDLKSGNATV